MNFHDRLRARDKLNQKTRGFFQARDFLEVETPILVPSPGTDVFIDVFESEYVTPFAREKCFLQTSPEFAMKTLLVKGCKKIYQITKAFRNGEVSDTHNVEFTILEWYRAEENLDAIIEDVKELVMETCSFPASDFSMMTMNALFLASCQIDIVNSQTKSSLENALINSVGLPAFAKTNKDYDWNDLFFHTLVEYVEPFLATLEAVFVTHWPIRLAVLAQQNSEDPRVADRFELYIDGLEIANGFQELRDAKEQRRRFEEDNEERKRLGKKQLPLPEDFLSALEQGLPRCAGVALGLDRLLMVSSGCSTISDLLPFKFRPKN